VGSDLRTSEVQVAMVPFTASAGTPVLTVVLNRAGTDEHTCMALRVIVDSHPGCGTAYRSARSSNASDADGRHYRCRHGRIWNPARWCSGPGSRPT
jgi:hypothetical protein